MDLKKIFRTLDFDKIECAAGVDLSEEAHAAIQRLANEYVALYVFARTKVNPMPRLQHASRDCRRCADSLSNNLKRLPATIQPFVSFRESIVNSNDLVEILNDMADDLEQRTATLPRRRVGRPRQNYLRDFIHGVYPIFIDVDGKGTAYVSQSRKRGQNYGGAFLDMIQEILDQTKFPNQIKAPYHSRDALARLIMREDLSSEHAPNKKRRKK